MGYRRRTSSSSGSGAARSRTAPTRPGVSGPASAVTMPTAVSPSARTVSVTAGRRAQSRSWPAEGGRGIAMVGMRPTVDQPAAGRITPGTDIAPPPSADGPMPRTIAAGVTPPGRAAPRMPPSVRTLRPVGAADRAVRGHDRRRVPEGCGAGSVPPRPAGSVRRRGWRPEDAGTAGAGSGGEWVLCIWLRRRVWVVKSRSR